MMQVVILSVVWQELSDAVDYYQKESPKTAIRFADAFDESAKVIESGPTRYREIRRGIRRYVMHSFPYSIVYALEANRVVVVALAHHRRNPDYWQGRVR